jgi:two-component system, cell cycle response regulator
MRKSPACWDLEKNNARAAAAKDRDDEMRVLIADDDPVARRLLEVTLTHWGYNVVAVAGGLEAIEALRAPDAPSLAILDWEMPGVDGVEVCRRSRKQAEGRYTYIILLTARHRKEDIVEGLQSGADDYVIKPFDTYELQARVRAARRIVELQDQLIASRDALEVQATHDPLTGLWNRRAIFEILNREIARSHRQGTPVAVILADVDLFKDINDTYGHLAGDQVLGEIARKMSARLRAYDSIGRFGGEEFLIVSPECHVSAPQTLAERIRASVEEDPVRLGDRDLAVTMSLGVAAGGPGGTDLQDKLLRAADAALYRAKQEGRNRVILADPVGLPQSSSPAAAARPLEPPRLAD